MDILDLRRKIQIKIEVREEAIIREAQSEFDQQWHQENIDEYLSQIKILKEILEEIDKGIQEMASAIEKERG